MGHADLSNICTFFVRRLYAKGRLSIKECVEGLQKAGEAVHASEGLYEDECMLAFSTEWCVRFLAGCQGHSYKPPQMDEVIVPILETEEQREVIDSWRIEGEPDDEEKIRILDGIQWRFGPGWRKKYKDVPILSYVSN